MPGCINCGCALAFGRVCRACTMWRQTWTSTDAGNEASPSPPAAEAPVAPEPVLDDFIGDLR